VAKRQDITDFQQRQGQERHDGCGRGAQGGSLPQEEPRHHDEGDDECDVRVPEALPGDHDQENDDPEGGKKKGCAPADGSPVQEMPADEGDEEDGGHEYGAAPLALVEKGDDDQDVEQAQEDDAVRQVMEKDGRAADIVLPGYSGTLEKGVETRECFPARHDGSSDISVPARPGDDRRSGPAKSFRNGFCFRTRW
jgi:hypothetical protein